jgi:transcriptional regulator with XRE-family HTH domain
MLERQLIKEVVRNNLIKYTAGKMKQNELADKLGISNQRLNNWMIGKSSVDMDYLYKICKILKISPNTMFNYESDINDLSEEDKEIIKKYKELDPGDRQCFKSMVDIKHSQKHGAISPSRTG